MLIVVIDSRLSIDTGTLFRVPKGGNVLLLTASAGGCFYEGSERHDDIAAYLEQIKAKHSDQAVHLAVLWSSLDQALVDLVGSLGGHGLLPRKTFVFLATLVSDSEGSAGQSIFDLSSTWQSGLPRGHLHEGNPNGFRLMVAYLGEVDSQKQFVSGESRLLLSETLAFLFWRGGQTVFLAFCSLFERQPGAVLVRPLGIRHWMPTISEIKSSLSARLARVLHTALQREIQEAGNYQNVAGHAQDEVTNLKNQLLAITTEKGNWPTDAQLYPHDWNVPIWLNRLEGSLDEQLKTMDSALRLHALKLCSDLGKVAADVRVKSQGLVDRALSDSHDYIVSDPRISFLARLLQFYYPEYRKIGEDLPKGADAPFTPAGSPGEDEVSFQVLSDSARKTLVDGSGGLLNLQSVIMWMIPLVVGLLVSIAMYIWEVSPWYWMLCGPFVGLIAIGIRSYMLICARNRIRAAFVDHITACQAWLGSHYARKAERVRMNARRLGVLQFIRHQSVVSTRLAALLSTLVTDWKSLISLTGRFPPVPDLGIDDDRVFSETEQSFREELAGLPARLVKLASSPSALGAEAAMLERIVNRQIPRLFEAHSEIVAPIDRLEDGFETRIIDPQHPALLAPVAVGEATQSFGKFIVVPDTEDYREWAKRIREGLPAIRPFELEFADAPLWAPVIFLIGPPQNLTQLQPSSTRKT